MTGVCLYLLIATLNVNVLNFLVKTYELDWGCSSVPQQMLSMNKTQVQFQVTQKKKNK
jgi:hypothetical protein